VDFPKFRETERPATLHGGHRQETGFKQREDLAPSDFCLFPNFELFLAGQRFSSNQEAIAAVEGYFGDLTKNHYRDGIMALEHRWNKCISLEGDYVGK